MKCLYAGCQTSEECPDNIFHKVVGSSSRDGKPLYICSEHFLKLKSSKTPSLVSYKQPVCKPATSARKGSNQDEKTSNAAKEDSHVQQKDNLGKSDEEQLERNQNEIKNKKESSELKTVTVGSIRGQNVSLPFSIRRKRELEEDKREVNDLRKCNDGGSPKGGILVEEEEKELKTVRIGHILQPNRTESRPSILRRRREPKKHHRNIEQFIVAEDKEKKDSELKKVHSSHMAHGPCRTVSFPLSGSEMAELVEETFEKEEEVDEGEDGNEPTQRERCIVVVEKEKPIPKIKTSVSGRPRGVLPSIIRRERGKLERGDARNNKQSACGEIRDTHVENCEKGDSPGESEVRKVKHREMVRRNKDSEEEIKVKQEIQGVRVRSSSKEKNEEENCVRQENMARKRSVEEMFKTNPLSNSYSQQFIEIDVINVPGADGVVTRCRLPIISSVHPSLLQSNLHYQKENAAESHGEDEVTKLSLNEDEAKKHCLYEREDKDNCLKGDEANNFNQQERAANDKSVEENGTMSSDQKENETSKYKCLKTYEGNKHRLEGNEGKEVEENGTMSSYQKENETSKYKCIKTYEGNKHRLEGNEVLKNQCSLDYEGNLDAEVLDAKSTVSSRKHCVESYENNLSWQLTDEKSSICSLIHNMEQYEGNFVEELACETLSEPAASVCRTIPERRRVCSAVGCNSSYPEVRLNKFPFDPVRNKIWCDFAYEGDESRSKKGYLCTRHFKVNNFARPDRMKLLKGANPSLPSGPLNPITQDNSPVEDSYAVYCSALNCGLSQKTHPHVPFAQFPSKGDSRYQEWCRIAGGVKNPRFLCGRHFDITQFSDSQRTYLEPRAIPKYKAGPFNPETNDYAPLKPDVSADSPASPTTAVSAVSPVIGQNIKIAAVSPVVGQTLRISGLDSLAGQQIRISVAGQHLKIAPIGSIFSQNIKPTDANNVPSMTYVVGNSADGGLAPGVQKNLEDVGNDEMDAVYKKCDAVGCLSSYKTDPQVKYFSFPAKGSFRSPAEMKRRQYWVDVVGGTKDDRARYLCQYHFAADTFTDNTRTSLVRKANPLFPSGPINPITKDYCPIGGEQRSLCSRNFLPARCCVDGCTTYSYNSSGLFGFPMHDREAYDEWTKRIGVFKYFTEQHIRTKLGVCPKHFSSCCTIIDEEETTVQLKFGALPTIDIPCFKGDPSEMNSFVQNRSLSSDEVEALEMLSESDRVCSLNDICEKENNIVTSFGLKRKIDDVMTVPNKKSKGNDEDSSKQLVLMPVEDAKGQQTYVVVDFSSNENFASISGQKYPEAVNAISGANESSGAKEPENVPSAAPLEKGLEEPGFSKLANARVCSYWAPGDFTDKEAFAKKRALINKERHAQKTKHYSLPGFQDKKNGNQRVGSKAKTAKEMYEDFSFGIQEDNIGNEVDVDIDETEQSVGNNKQPVVPTEKTDCTETALLKVFGACEASDDNVFSCFVDSSKVPDHEEEKNEHSYCSSNSLNVIRSAAELCEFNELKIKQLERLIRIGEDTSSELEQILVKHLSSVMCITGVDFLKKCFDQVLKEAILKKKEKDKARKCPNAKPEPPIPLHERYSSDTKKLAVALQTFSGKAYHAMTQLIDLPYQAVVRDWTSHKNGDPGFSDRAFKILREEAHKKQTVTVSLGMEEVPLKQDVSWDGERSFGFTDLGYGAVDYDYIPEATRAVVFFATALNRTWKIPLGYCLADNLTASVRANLVVQYLYRIGETGVRCIALVCNYSLMTYQMLIELGAVSEEYHSPQTGSFPHPSIKGDRVHCFVDVHQLTKSINTLWVEKKVFTFKNKDGIEWSHMSRMNEFVQSDNKFSNPGLENVYKDLMCLKSLIKRDPRSSYKYNALVLTLLKNLGLEGFENVTGTAMFLEKLNSIIELFSSCNSFDNGERQILTKKNLPSVIQKLNSVIGYFSNLTYNDGTRIMMSQRKLPLVLLFSNITSLKTMIKKVFSVEKYKVKAIRTELFNLDGVHQTLLQMTDGKEVLLTPLEFKEAFFKFVENLTLEPSSRLGVRQNIEESTQHSVESSLGFSNLFSYQFSPVSTVCESVHEFFTENVIENWLQVTQCTDCSQLIQKELLRYGNHNSKGNVIEDIHRMLRMAETILAELDEIPMDAFKSWFDKLANKTLNSMTSLNGFKNNSHLFNSKPFGEVTHFTVMVKDMLRIFLRLRLCFLSRQEKIRIRPPRQYSLRFCLGRSWA